MNDGTAQTYTYQLQNASADLTSFVNTANAQGSSGYRYEGPLTYGDLYRRTAARRPPTRTRRRACRPTRMRSSRRRTASQSGYWFLGPIVVASVQANIYMKNNASSATYTYDALAPASTVSDFIAQANSEGAKGYRAKGAMAFGTAISWVYVKDQTQSPTFRTSRPRSSRPARASSSSRTRSAARSAYLSDMALGTTPPLAMASFYFNPKNCTGFLHDAESAHAELSGQRGCVR